jgi:ABC-2 type transport system permease protein
MSSSPGVSPSAVTTATIPSGSDLGLHPRAVAQFFALSKRAINGSIRQLPLLLPSIIFPMFFVAINTASFEKLLPLLQQVYPKLTSFLTFTLAATVVQGVLFGCVSGATDLATDIEQGFFERMIASPMSRTAILVARLAGSTMIGIVQGAVFTGILMVFGARLAGGFGAFFVLLLSSGLLALAFGGLLSAIAIKSGSAEAVQSSFPIVFLLLFASSAFFPAQKINGAFRKVAEWNPLSKIVEALRELIINGWSTSAALKALLIPLLMACITFALALFALKSRLEDR